jgi:hypothetical protein
MMGELLKRRELIARARQRQAVQNAAEKLRTMFGSGAVEVEDARVVVSGLGLLKRWLIDPSLRFLGGGLT